MNNKPDQSFDAIAQKFEQNIYGTSKGRLRHELLLHNLEPYIQGEPLKVLDAGGGTGMMSGALVSMGHKVLLNDVSGDALAIASQNYQHQNLEIQQGEILQLEGEYDLILCHAVLEWLRSPLDTIEHLISLLPADGVLSLSFFNKDAARFGNLLYGNFDFVQADMQQRNRVRLNPNNPQSPQAILQYLQQKPVTLLHQSGIRCFHDYMKNPDMQNSHYEQLKAMELEYGHQHPYLWLGKYFHIIVRKLAED